MKYEFLLERLGKQGFFDLATLVQITDERRKSIQMQLSRWCRNGKLIPLRRGMYAIPEPYHPRPVNPAALANHLYTPSYISLFWALGYYGLIPEKVVALTCISSRVTRFFENEFGRFHYRHVKPCAFFGYRQVDMNGCPVRIAEPEKALLDLWYLEPGSWTPERLFEMRFQNTECLDVDRLEDYAQRFVSKKLNQIVNTWIDLKRTNESGAVAL